MGDGFFGTARRLIFPTDEEIQLDVDSDLSREQLDPNAESNPLIGGAQDAYGAYSRAVQSLPGPHPDSPVGKFNAGLPPVSALGGGLSAVGSAIASPFVAPPPMPQFDPQEVADGASSFDRGPQLIQPTQADVAPASEARSNPIKAVRMPDGKILYTNVDGYAGQDVDPAEAARAGRQAAAAGGGADSTDRIMRSMVAAAARNGRPISELGGRAIQNEQQQTMGAEPDPIMAGPMQTGREFAPSGGTLSMMRGSPDQEFDQEMQEAGRMIGRETAATELERVQLPLEEQMRIGNPAIQEGREINEQFGPKLQKAQQVAAAKMAIIEDPNHPQFIADPKMRAVKARQIQSELEAARQSAEALMSVMVKQRVPSAY